MAAWSTVMPFAGQSACAPANTSHWFCDGPRDTLLTSLTRQTVDPMVCA
jgi:hypothetical protein